MAAALIVVCSMATQHLLASAARLYEQRAGRRFDVVSIGGVEVVKRVERGDAFDVVVLAADAIDKLIAGGHVVAGSRVDLVRSGVAVAVRAGAPRVDIGSEKALREAVGTATGVGYSTGPSGVYLMRLFERWGIADEIRDRLVVAPPGVPVGSLLAQGKASLGFQQLSELIHVPGIDILGPLPPQVQTITTFSGGIVSGSSRSDDARELLAFLASPETAQAKRAEGMDPA